MTIRTQPQDPARDEHDLTINIETLKDLSPLNADLIRGGATDQRSKTIDCPV